jgi:hypothetical protein
MMSVFLAPGILLLGLFRASKVSKQLWLLIGALLTAYVLLEWGGNLSAIAWLHTSPLALPILLCAALALPLAARLVLPIQIIVFIFMWYLAPSVTS